jgi:protein-tyrosine phosphatase
MTRIWERLWIGGIDNAEELADENPHGIMTVISLSILPVHTRRWDISYMHLPIEDNMAVPVQQFDRIMDAIGENIRWGTALLHCSLGISRAPSLAAAYMDAVGCMGINAAIKEIRQMRPFIHPSTVLVESLKENLE